MNKEDILEEFSKLSIGALSMIAALAWNEAFINLFKQYPNLQKHGPWIYAILVTILTLFIVSIITSYKQKLEKKAK
jgi:hypothetical protein